MINSLGALDAKGQYEAEHSIDGAEQWTCTVGAKVEVPEGDELYDRRNDPFQLTNIISKCPDVATDLLQKLKLFMAELVAH